MMGSRVDDAPDEEVAAPVDELSVHIGEDGLPTMTQVPIEEYRREVMAHLAYIAQARDAVARMTDASARAAKADGRVERARCSAESSKALEDLKAATSVLEALRPKGPLLTPEQRSKLRVLTPEELKAVMELDRNRLLGALLQSRTPTGSS